MRRRYVLAPQAARDLATAFDWKGFWDMAAHVGTLVGLTAAGVWGYFNFIKSRTYHPRLEMTVSGELRSKGVQQYLVPRVTLKNIGNSKVKLIQSGSGYRIWTTKREEADETRELVWRGGKPVFGLFLNHKWIEPETKQYSMKTRRTRERDQDKKPEKK